MSIRINGQVVASQSETSNLAESPYTTNRILEIPQNIKLELNNGTLTLKAGSKVYDGTGYSWIIQSDSSRTLTSNNTYTIVVEKDSRTTHIYGLTETHSQNTQPTSRGVWINTDTGATKWSNDGTTWGDCSLTLGIFTVSNGAISSIDQIFNGFGYIGSTLYMLPGVKLLQGFGKYDDGSNRTLEQATSSVNVYTLPSTANNGLYDIYYHLTSGFTLRDHGYLYYNAETNKIDDTDYPGANRGIVLGTFSTDSNHKISACKFVDVDSVANSNLSNISSTGKSFITEQIGATSGYIDYTPGASGTTYVALETGWVTAYGANGTTASGTENYIQIILKGTSYSQIIPTYLPLNTTATLFVTKGQQFQVNYRIGAGSGTLGQLRLYKAKGAV